MKLLQFELQKLFYRKSVMILLMLTICIIIANFTFFDYTWGYTVLNQDGSVQYADGKDSVVLRKQIGDQFSGVLDRSLYLRIQDTILQAEEAYANYPENRQQSLMRKFTDLKSILSYYTESEADGRFVIGYCDGWSKFVTNFSNIIVLCMTLLLVGGVSGIFANENETHMMYLLSASPARLGQLVKVKYLAMGIYTVFMFTVLFAFQLLLDGGYYGLTGINCGIQASAHYVSSNYSLNFGELALLLYVGGLIGSMAIASMIAFISLMTRKTSTTMMVSLLFILAPLLFDFSDTTLPQIQKWVELFPTYFINAKEVYRETNLYWGLPIQPVLSTLICLFLIVGVYLITKRRVKTMEIIG